MKSVPRILPLVGVAIGGVLAVNALSGARDLPSLLSGAQAFAEETATGAKPNKAGKQGAATDEATDMLSDRIEKGRALATKLERLVSAAPELPRAMHTERPAPRAMPSVAPPAREGTAEQRLGALLAMARSRLQAEGEIPAQPAPEPLVGRAPLPGRRIAASLDDDLFEDAPVAFDRLAGARR